MASVKDRIVKFVGGIVVATVVASSVYVFTGTQTVHVKGESMAPTLDNGQLLFVDSTPQDIEFGDVVIARTEDNEDIVKRVVGLPGDTIEFKDHMVYRNGKLMTNFHSKQAMKNEMELPNEVERTIQLGEGKNAEYYVMGDNLSVSVDSRQHGAFTQSNLLGKVYFH